MTKNPPNDVKPPLSLASDEFRRVCKLQGEKYKKHVAGVHEKSGIVRRDIVDERLVVLEF